jgi:hypothetical protein
VPELDPDLARLIGLGLLAVVVLLLLAVLGSLGRLRKSVEATAARMERATVLEEPRPESVGPVAAARTEAEPAREPQAATVAEPEPEPVSRAEAEAVQAAPETLEAIPASETGPAERESEPLAREEEPVEVREQTAQEPAAREEQPAVEEPQEQPFERDGRWWFRRGDELLVYNDATGQWEQASPAAGSPVAASGAVATEQAPAQTQEQQGFWKCPSCGAVNGSTATSCRMCFTARP